MIQITLKQKYNLKSTEYSASFPDALFGIYLRSITFTSQSIDELFISPLMNYSSQYFDKLFISQKVKNQD